jgi:hypothetical protein
MSILNPTKIETIDYGQQLWQAIFNANAQKLNDYFNKIAGLWDGTATEGQTVVWDNALGKWKPSAVPYPVPQAAVALTIGAGADTTVNTSASKFFTLPLSKNTNIVFSNFNTGMVIDLITTQDGTGGWATTFTGCTVVGTVTTTANVSTWYRCFKVGSVTMVNVVANFTF